MSAVRPEAGEIGRPLGVDEDLGVEGVAEPVGGEDVEPGPLVIPPVTAVLLNSVPDHQAGTASGLFNTSRQLGGALAVAAFGALLARPDGFLTGLRQSLLIAAGIGLATAATSRLLATSEHRVAADDVCVTADVPSAGACAAYIPVERGGAR
jgi:MFS family permease